MITKYTTGQAIMIPATIRSAEEVNGKIIYQVETDHWDGIPEDQIVINDQAAAMKTFREALMEQSERW